MTLWVLLSVSGCAWLDMQQRQMIYRPTPASVTEVAGLRPGDQRYFLDVPQADACLRIELWWLPQATRDAPTLLY